MTEVARDPQQDQGVLLTWANQAVQTLQDLWDLDALSHWADCTNPDT